ncbi:hypothetical protein SAMN02787118_12947 [Streptomyces mirabilis]|uniref:Uncharacterized protein n=1 Tax=Streptomyces mirabilis TaxID=68239 RepID=A0A1I2UT65_9ACTN|nr:DUF6009 family protein [Streptomyces mirabilis]SFG80315.1 hypothetical protein SAMN02787118_12947 [Streptomyces mirabilis]
MVHRNRGVADSVSDRLGVQPVVEGLGGQCSGPLQAGVQRQARPLDHTVGDHDQSGALLQREGLLEVVGLLRARRRMVGHALLDDHAEPDSDSGLYERRVFFFLPHDRDSLPGGLYREGAPGEAVDPRTIEVKMVGEKTPRSQSGPAARTGSRS